MTHWSQGLVTLLKRRSAFKGEDKTEEELRKEILQAKADPQHAGFSRRASLISLGLIPNSKHKYMIGKKYKPYRKEVLELQKSLHVGNYKET